MKTLLAVAGVWIVATTGISAAPDPIRAAPAEGFVLPVEFLQVPAPIVSDFTASAEDWRIVDGITSGSQPAQHESGTGGNGRLSDYAPWQTPVETLLDIAVVFDASGSMAEEIGQVQAAAAAVVQSLRESGNVRLGLVRFTDYEAERDAVKDWPLTPEFDAYFGPEAAAIWATGSGGATFPEDQLAGIDAAFAMSWRSDPSVARAIIVMSDAPARADPKRTVEGLAEACRAKRIQIFPVLVDDPNLPPDLLPVKEQQAQVLAAKTGGRVLALRDAGSAADAILEISRTLARERKGRPRYWRAPQKFLGDQSRYFGTSLSYRLSSAGTGTGFVAADVILHGVKHTLAFHGYLDPLAAGPGAPAMHLRSVALDEASGWVHHKTQVTATGTELAETLSGLRNILVRADYHENAELAALDDVILGAVGDPTDRATTPAAREDIREQLEMLGWVNSLEEALSPAGFENALRRELRRRGLDTPAAMNAVPGIAGALAQLYREPAGKSFVEVMLQPARRFHQVEIRRLRQAGPKADAALMERLIASQTSRLFLAATKLAREAINETTAKLVDYGATQIELSITGTRLDRPQLEARRAEAKAKRDQAVQLIDGWAQSKIAEPIQEFLTGVRERMPIYDEIYR